MLGKGRLRKEARHDGAPLGHGGRSAKPDGVVFQRIPFQQQQVSIGRFDAVLNLIAPEALGLGYDGTQPSMSRFFKVLLLTGLNSNISNFKNHLGLTFDQ